MKAEEMISRKKLNKLIKWNLLHVGIISAVSANDFKIDLKLVDLCMDNCWVWSVWLSQLLRRRERRWIIRKVLTRMAERLIVIIIRYINHRAERSSRCNCKELRCKRIRSALFTAASVETIPTLIRSTSIHPLLSHIHCLLVFVIIVIVCRSW